MGRSGAPSRPWKRSLGIAGIVVGSMSTLLLIPGDVAAYAVSQVFFRGGTGVTSPGVMGVVMSVLPLAVGICSIIWSARLTGRNAPETAPPPSP